LRLRLGLLLLLTQGEKMLEEVLLDIDELDELLGAVIPCLAVGFVALDIVVASIEFYFA
jgi:hypothetical protein